MTYPMKPLLGQLQVQCTPEDYLKVTSQYIKPGRNVMWVPYPAHEYWSMIPTYTYAWSPICGLQYQEPADTYSLRNWGGYNHLRDALYLTQLRNPGSIRRCPHFLGIAEYVNLHGQTPDELETFSNYTGEVPMVTPWLVSEEESFAILHGLPICQIVNDEFIPCFTIFVLTYFSASPNGLLGRYYAQEFKRTKDDPEFFPATLAPVGTPSPSLTDWAREGKLGWLELDESALPLSIGKGWQLPEIYQDIHGNRQMYYWQR